MKNNTKELFWIATRILLTGASFFIFGLSAVTAQETPSPNPSWQETLTLSNKALSLYNEDKFEEAIIVMERVILMMKDLELGIGDMNRGLENLANMYFAKGNLDKAEAIFIDRLEWAEREVGPEHYHVVPGLKGLVEFYRDIGDPLKSIPLQKRVIAISKETLGPENIVIGTELKLLASLYEESGQIEDAKNRYAVAVEAYENNIKDEQAYFELYESLIKLSAIYDSLNEQEMADSFRQRANTVAKEGVEYLEDLGVLPTYEK